MDYTKRMVENTKRTYEDYIKNKDDHILHLKSQNKEDVRNSFFTGLIIGILIVLFFINILS